MRILMISAVLAATLLLTTATPSAAQEGQPIFSGVERQLQVDIPRIDTTAVVDGVLDDAVWSRAARLTGFSQYQPVDGRPAEEPTDVYVWYAPDALYFGIHAVEAHGDEVRATRANRDNIASEDQIQILLDTYNDRRTAFLFAVNPLGVQADGTRSDAFGGGAGGRSAMGGGSRAINFMDGNTDLNPDFVFDSMGRLTDTGFEIEVRIPFKSLRYQEAEDQDWGLHILRRSMHSGFLDSWAPTVRARASFLGQAGELVGLRDLRRGRVLEVTPTATGRLDGAEDEAGDWAYDRDGDLGVDVRWGIKQNLTLNGTVNPDFSQVEADVGQVTLNERFALFYPEKRPFFLDGLELFDTPGQLIYTRRIVAPVAGAKVAGKVGAWNVATILAADNTTYSDSGGNTPVFGVARLRRDFSRNATVGAVLTTREDGPDYSRLVGVDGRFYHSSKYYIELQGVHSHSDHDDANGQGTMFETTWDRTGRSWGFHYTLSGVSPDFEAAAGFVNRTNFVTARASNRLTAYGAPGALVETASTFVTLNRYWAWEPWEGRDNGPIEGRDSISPSATLRGGWRLSGNINREFFAYDPADYTSYTVATSATTVGSFTVPGVEDNQWSASLRVTAPTWQIVSANASYAVGRTPLFREASPGESRQITATVDLRPTQALRATFQVTRLVLNRTRDDSRFSTETIPRLKLEYQITPAVFVRFIGQYTTRDRAPLRDRDGRLIFVDDVPDEGADENLFQTDWLFSYRPIPGTLVYVGYSATFEEAESFRYRDLRRQVDGFFAKVSYLIRT